MVFELYFIDHITHRDRAAMALAPFYRWPTTELGNPGSWVNIIPRRQDSASN